MMLQSTNDALLLQVEMYVQQVLAARPAQFKWTCPANAFPSHWAPQQSNTELFEVELNSPEIASLLAAMKAMGNVNVLKVCC